VGAALDGGAASWFHFFQPVRAWSIRRWPDGWPRRCAAGRIVAVTVDPDDETLDRIVRNLRPGLIQLHGREAGPGARDRLRTGVGLIKALPIAEPPTSRRRAPSTVWSTI